MKRIPDVVICAGCKRRLDPSVYQITLDGSEPVEKVTRIYSPEYPYFAVMCSNCAHYTVFSPRKADKPKSHQSEITE